MSAIRESAWTGAPWLVLAASVLAALACRAEDILSFPKPDTLSTITPGNAGKLRVVGQIGAPVVKEVAWSSDGGYLGLRSAEGIALYRHEKSKKPSLSKVAVLATDRSPLSFSFHGRGDRVLTCNGGRVVTIWPLAPGAAPEEVHVDAGVRAVAFSPAAGVLAAATDDGKLRIWRDEALKEAPDVLDDHENGAAGISIAAGGKLAVTWAGWNDARVWNLETGTRVMDVTTRSHTSSWILDPAWVGPDGALWAGVPGKTARWSIPSAERMPEFPARLALGPGCFSPDGKKCVARTDDGLGLAAVQDGRTLLPLVKTEGFAVGSFEPVQGKLLALCADGKLTLCDATSGAGLYSENRGPPTRILGASRDRRWLLCGTEGQDLTLVDLRAVPKARKLKAPGTDVLDAVLDSTPSCVITRSPVRLNEPSRLTAWTLRGAQLRPAAPLETKGEVHSFDLSPTGKLVALGTTGTPTLELLSTGTGKPKAVVPLKVKGDGNASVADVAFHPGGKTLAVAVTEITGVLLVNVDDGKVTAELPRPEGFDSSVMRIAFDSRGKLLGAGTLEHGAFVCDIEGERVVAAFRTEGWTVDALDFSPDSKLLATAVSQHIGFKTTSRIEVFDLLTGLRVFERQAHTDTVNALRFVQKGKLLASSDYGGSTRLWGIDEEKRTDPPGESSKK